MGDSSISKTTRRGRQIFRSFVALLAIFASVLGLASAQQATPAAEHAVFSLPDDVGVRHATIWSEGTRMAANIFSPKAVTGKLPTIIMAYGWGGTMQRVREASAAASRPRSRATTIASGLSMPRWCRWSCVCSTARAMPKAPNVRAANSATGRDRRTRTSGGGSLSASPGPPRFGRTRVN
jgi:hypothetical protein